MRSLTKAYEVIKEFEGLYLKAYLDPVGIPTIGWGSTKYPDGKKVKIGDKISREQAQKYLEHDVSIFCDVVNRLVKVEINDNQFCALVSFCYNLGEGNFKSSTLLKKLNAGDAKGASAEFPRWNKADGKVFSGLVRRRKIERELFDSPVGAEIGPVLVQSPAWFEPFKKIIQALVDAIFGKKIIDSGVIPDGKDISIVDSILDKNDLINKDAISEAIKWKDNSKISNKKYILLCDFSLNESQARLHLVDMRDYSSSSFKVAHGKNSDPNKDGLATEFSNSPGSYKSSLGPILIGKEFKNPKWKRVRLLFGLLPTLNSNILKREILIHTTAYVNDVIGQPIGDTLGCFGISEKTGIKIFDLIEGCLLFAWDDTYKGE